MPDAIVDDPFLRLGDVEREVGMTKSTIYKRIREGTFPRPRQLGGGQVRWPLSTIRRWKDGLGEGVAAPPPVPMTAGRLSASRA